MTTIREAKREDWPGIERVVRAAWHQDYTATGEVYLALEELDDKVDWLHDEFDAFGSRFLVADDGGRIVGLAITHGREGRVWLDDLFVEPAARRRGVARDLVKAAAPPDAEVLCEVNARNAPGLALFRELGFEKVVETVVLRRGPVG